MTIADFLSDRLGRIVLQGGCAAASALFLLATGTQPGVVALLLMGLILVFVLAQLWECVRLRRRLAELKAIMEGLDQKQLFAECAPKPEGLWERELFALMHQSGQAMVGAVSEAQAAQREYREYVEQWVHEIKTPITAARLISRTVGPDTRRRLERELAQIDAHVERALFYARAESPEKDLVIRETSLEELADQALQSHRALLIQSGVRVETRDLDQRVYTDGKWVCFLLGQLLQNAARYRSAQPVVTLSARALGRRVELTVEDNGIGIPAHELPRIFDRGFTGSNGRSRGGSTGLGLYLARRLAAALEIELRAASEEGKGTRMTLLFPARENLSKL